MLHPFLWMFAKINGLTCGHGIAYGVLNGCYVTLSEVSSYREISVYVGPPGAPEDDHTPGSLRVFQLLCAIQQFGFQYATISNELNGCVVTLRSPCYNHSLRRSTTMFLDDFMIHGLGKIKYMVSPKICACCGHYSPHLIPVQVARTAVVPMHAACVSRFQRSSPGDALPGKDQRPPIVNFRDKESLLKIWKSLSSSTPVRKTSSRFLSWESPVPLERHK